MIKTASASAAARHGLRRPMEGPIYQTLSFDDLELLELSALACCAPRSPQPLPSVRPIRLSAVVC